MSTKTDNRNVLLDLMRGIAGLAVPMLHLREGFMASPSSWSEVFCGHNYLAVEFYLLLMAYMFGTAYDHRWATGMRTWEFLKRRLKRMHPLVISGVVLGGIVYFLQLSGCAWMGKSFVPACSLSMKIWVFVSALLMVPTFGTSMLAPLNACSWTLYYQYLANLLYALIIRRLNLKWLVVMSALSAVVMAAFVFHWIGDAHLYSFEGGWGTTSNQYSCGLVRLAFPMFFGLLLSRLKWNIRLPRGLATAIVAFGFIGILYLPAAPIGLSLQSIWNGVYEMAVVWVLLPMLLLISVGSESYGGKFAQVAAFFGKLSYPVYMSHYMFMSAHRYYVVNYSGNISFAGNCLVFLVEFIALLLIGFGVMKFWERVKL